MEDLIGLFEGRMAADAFVIGSALVLLCTAGFVVWQEWRDRPVRTLQHHITIGLGVMLASAAIWLALHSVVADAQAVAGAQSTRTTVSPPPVDGTTLPTQQFEDKTFVFTKEE